MKIPLAKCPICNSRKIYAVNKDLEFLYRGRKVIVPQVECDECQHCGEIITDYAANQRIDAVVFGQNKRRSPETIESAAIHRHKKRLSWQAHALLSEQAPL